MAPTSSAASASTPLPASFSQAQAKKAVNALLKHASKAAEERQETELIEREEHVWLNINTSSPSTKKKIMPVRIQLPYPPLPPPPATSVCLITKDPQREYKDLIASHNVKFINRVVGVEKLKGKFKPYEARRQLMRDHELWLCDDRVVGMMPGLLGKMFFEAKKTPIPVNLKRKDLKAELARAVNSTYWHPSTGTSHAIRIATISSSSTAQTLENVLAALPAAIGQIKGGWDNVLSVGIKTSSSVLLPIWARDLESRFERKGKAADSGAEQDAEMAEAEEEEIAPPKKSKVAVAKDEVKKSVKAKDTESSKSDKVAKKKSSTIGSGGAGKRAKAAVLGKA